MSNPYDAIVVLGGGRTPGGYLTPLSVQRLNEGRKLYMQGIAPKIMVLGGRHSTYNPNCVELNVAGAELRSQYLCTQAVDKEDILSVCDGRDTIFEAFTTKREAERIGLKKMLIVTNDEHVDRALWTYQRILGTEFEVDCRGVPSYGLLVEGEERENFSLVRDYFATLPEDIPTPGSWDEWYRGNRRLYEGFAEVRGRYKKSHRDNLAYTGGNMSEGGLWDPAFSGGDQWDQKREDFKRRVVNRGMVLYKTIYEKGNTWHDEQQTRLHTEQASFSLFLVEQFGNEAIRNFLYGNFCGGLHSRSDLLNDAVLNHDIGKKFTLETDEEGKTKTPGHDWAGAALVDVRFRCSPLYSIPEITHVCELVLHHHDIHNALRPAQRDQVDEQLREIERENVGRYKDLLLMTWADTSATDIATLKPDEFGYRARVLRREIGKLFPYQSGEERMGGASYLEYLRIRKSYTPPKMLYEGSSLRREMMF